jgi:glycosyltransferase involved in cell wall biosynthesis
LSTNWWVPRKQRRAPKQTADNMVPCSSSDGTKLTKDIIMENTDDDSSAKNIFADSGLPLAIIVAATRWKEPPRMRHHIARQLMRWCNVLFVETIDGSENAIPALVEDRLAVAKVSTNGSVPLKIYSNEPFTHWLCNRRLAAILEQLIAKVPASHKLLFTFIHSFPEVMRITGIDARIYVCVDEFPRMWRRRSRGNPLRYFYQSRLNQWYENRVAASADLCLSPHQGLVRKLKRHCRQVELFLHAHDFSGTPPDFEASDGGFKAAPGSPLAELQVAYMGFIHYRLSADMLLEVVRQRDMRLHMIGPVAPSFDVSAFASFTNVIWHGAVTGNALAELLRRMDVLVIPYYPSIPEVEVLTSTSKLFQYIAAGKPIVTSQLPCFMKLPEEVLVASTSPADFVRRIRSAREGDDDAARRLRSRIAAENTWSKRGSELREIIRKCVRIDLTEAAERGKAGV